jgi:3-oxoacyl-[acyl-carrier protein] reductase
MDFTGKKAVVTGAGGIFGGRIAQDFAAAGASVCLSDPRPEVLRALPRRLGIPADRCLLHATELRDEKSIDELIDVVAKAWMAPDIVVNVAGIYPRSGSLLKLTVEDWDTLMDVNLRAPFLVGRGFANLMLKHGVKGSIVNISSGAARGMATGSVPYCTSKTALDRLSKGMALELAKTGIRVNVVEPGFASGSDVSPLTKEYVDAMLQRIPMNRESGPHDAPHAVMYLCSDMAGFITGATLSVDGGNSLGTYRPDFHP